MSACRPSATPFGLALGPDLPREDELYPGNLGHFGEYDSHIFLATHTGILASCRSSAPCGAPSALAGTLPYPALADCHIFGAMLSPGKFSAQGHSTSEMLRTL